MSMHQHFMIHKPFGYLSQFINNQNKRKNKKLLGELYCFPEGTMSIGRLDESSEGLLLLTTDGKVSALIRSRKVEKEYYVQLDGNITDEAILPVPENLYHWFASPQSAIRFLRHAAKLDFKKLGNRRSLNLPGVSCSISDQIRALEEIAGTKTSKLIKKIPDKKIEDIVNNWPQNFMADRAIELGFVADKDFKDIIQIYINEEINT